MLEVRHYLTRDGRNLFVEWLGRLRDPLAKTAVIRRLNRLEQGNFGDFKALRSGVYELRVDVGPGYRVYYARSGKTLVLLLCAGSKRTQEADIERACSCWQDWLSRPD